MQALRTDVAEIFLSAQADLLRHGLALKGLMYKRGWLKVPPPYYPGKPPD